MRLVAALTVAFLTLRPPFAAAASTEAVRITLFGAGVAYLSDSKEGAILVTAPVHGGS